MDKFETLNDETTILMIEQDTFTVARFKELIQNQLYQRLSQSFKNRNDLVISINHFLNPDLDIVNEELQISINNCQLGFPPEGLECKLLNLETKEWQTGKLRIIADVKTLVGESSNVEINKVTLEFASEQPTFEAESSLDEIINSFS